MQISTLSRIFGLVLAGAVATASEQASAQNKVTVNWAKTVFVSKTTPTLQVVVNPMLKPGSQIEKQSYQALKELGAEYVRYVPWFPYPRAAVAEMQAPTKDQTFRNFEYADQYAKPFLEATAGHTIVMNFSTTPVWMWNTPKPVVVPDDPDQVFWDYNPGTALRDSTGKEVGEYFARLISWYTKGGFTDELGKYHKSGYSYKFPWWEVLNEPDLEHKIGPVLYTKMYDAIVTEMKKVAPATKFVGLSLAREVEPEYFEYFLNPKNHKKGIPLDAISYHFYGRPTALEDPSSWQYSFFEQANAFLDRVRYIESIRKRLSPLTTTQINEVGNILKDRNYTGVIPDDYWNLSGAMFAYLHLELTKLGIEYVGESQLVGYPTQFPDVSMMNWKNGKPNARFWTLKLLKDNFGPGDQLTTTSVNTPDVAAQGFITAKGKKLLLINKRNKDVTLELPADMKDAKIESVDVSTGENRAVAGKLAGNSVILKAFSVSVVQGN